MARTQPAQSASREHGGIVRYVVVWGVLVLLTAITIVVGRFELGAASTAVALAIATAKAALVALFFMHLWDSEGENSLVIVVSLVLVGVLGAGVMADFSTRLPAALPITPPVEALPD